MDLFHTLLQLIFLPNILPVYKAKSLFHFGYKGPTSCRNTHLVLAAAPASHSSVLVRHCYSADAISEIAANNQTDASVNPVTVSLTSVI